jgi:3-isopropylmalate dehydrogenase
MKRDFRIAVFEGDGIGPEITAPTLGLIEELARHSNAWGVSFQPLPGGAACYAETGEALPAKSLDAAREADAILLAAMGLPHIRYPDGTEITPQIDIRMELGLFAGVRPVRISPGQPTPLRLPERRGVDFVLIRESTEGLFFTKGRGEVSETEARETLRITRNVTEQVSRFAFELARERKAAGRGPGRVTLVDKANVFRAFAFMRKVFDEVAAEYPDISTDHAYVDAFAMWMVQRPWEFDVVLTENMFGDILSDLGAGLMGGLGVAPSADIGSGNAVFQPCHGTAPDIAGQGVANPFAMILSAAMMLDWLGQRHDLPEMTADGARLRQAVEDVVGARTAMTRDLGGRASTQEAATAVATRLFP